MNMIKNIDIANIDLIGNLANEEYATPYLETYHILCSKGVSSRSVANVLKKFSFKDILNDVKYNDFRTRKYKREYDKVLKNWLVLGEKLGLTDSLDLSLFLNGILYDGYLSFNHQFSFDAEGRINKTGLYYFDVFNSSGVCMNFSHLLSDFLNKAGYKTSAMICNCKDEDMISLDYDLHKEKFKVKSRINYDGMSNKNDYFSHMVTLIFENDINNFCYLYDITNRLAFHIENMNKALVIAGAGKMCMNPFLSYLCAFTKEKRNVLEDFIVCDSYTNVFEDKDFLKKYDVINHLCRENKDKLEENYLLTKDSLIDIAEACKCPKILKLKGL